jgi:hypothetical protein
MSREARKRPGGATEGSSASGKVSIDEIELTELRYHSRVLGRLHAPIDSTGIYHMDSSAAREQLARDIWTLTVDVSMAALRENNAELVEVLRAQIANTTTVTAEYIEAKERLIDGMLLDICRAQNQKRMPFATAAMGVLAGAYKIPFAYTTITNQYHRGLEPSESWTNKFMVEARAHRPPPLETMLPGVAVETFDNLTVNIDYQGYVVGGEGGKKLDMTNHFSAFLPRRLARPGFDALQICECLPSPRLSFPADRTPAPPVCGSPARHLQTWFDLGWLLASILL